MVALDASTGGVPLSAALTVIRVTTLVPNNQDAKPGVFLPVDDGVGEVGQRVDSPTICSRRSNTWMLLKQLRVRTQ